MPTRWRAFIWFGVNPYEVEGGAHQVQSGGATRWSPPHIGVKDRQRAGFPAPMVPLDDVVVVGQ